ncbi:MAG: hypothetical protein V3T83_00050, partial [Acidobacteriota bacterium]
MKLILAVMLLLALDAPLHSGDLGWAHREPCVDRQHPDLLRDSVASLHRAAQVRMKPAPPLLANPGTAVFGAENEMAVKAEVRRWHASVRHPSRARHVFGSV